MPTRKRLKYEGYSIDKYGKVSTALIHRIKKQKEKEWKRYV